jgi:hypothetical protein
MISPTVRAVADAVELEVAMLNRAECTPQIDRARTTEIAGARPSVPPRDQRA